ncbi:MAG: hypothetical protein R6W81_06255 [Bacteroidales bacterium]
MKIIISTFMIFIGSALFAQNSKLETIYSQIPAPQDKFLCDAEYYAEEMALFESLSAQLEELRLQLNEDLKNTGDETYNTISAGFPTAEELKRVDNLSQEEQQAFWQKIEADQERTDKAIANNTQKYQDEKEKLGIQVTQYQDELLKITEEYSEVHLRASEVKSDKRQIIYDTCMENNTLSKNGQKQIEEISVELCSVVSPVYLKGLRFIYGNLKQNMSLYRRLSVIEIAEFSTLTEEVVCKQNAAQLDLNDLEILSQYITSYRMLYDILPGGINNQTWSKF